MRLGQPRLEPNRLPCVSDAGLQRRVVRVSRDSRHLVRDELRIREAGVCHRERGVGSNGGFEVLHGRADEIRVETLDLQPALDVRPVRVQTRCLPHAEGARGRNAGHAQLAREGRDDAVLKRKDLVEPAVYFCIRDRFALHDVHDACRDAQVWTVALVAAGDDEVRANGRRDLVQARANPSGRLHDAPAIDYAEESGVNERREIAGDGFGDAGGKPGDFGVARDVGEVHDGERLRPVRRRETCDRGLWGRRRGRTRRDRGDEPVPATRNGSHVGGRARFVIERFPQFRDGLCERVLRDVGARPDFVEEFLFGDEGAWPFEQVEQQVERLWRERQLLRPLEEAIGRRGPR